jgi:hypothetical protein
MPERTHFRKCNSGPFAQDYGVIAKLNLCKLLCGITVVALSEDLGQLLATRIGVNALYTPDELRIPPATEIAETLGDANITARFDVADQIAPGLHERLVVNATGEYERANVEMIGERCNPFQRGRVRDRG